MTTPYLQEQYSKLEKEYPEILFAYNSLSEEGKEEIDAIVIQVRDKLDRMANEIVTDRLLNNYGKNYFLSTKKPTLIGPAYILVLLYKVGRFLNSYRGEVLYAKLQR